MHRFSDGPGPARIGGIDVPSPHGLAAHSDGDVVYHAIADAILGAIGSGDIGELFPDTDMNNKNLDSRILANTRHESLNEWNRKDTINDFISC